MLSLCQCNGIGNKLVNSAWEGKENSQHVLIIIRGQSLFPLVMINTCWLFSFPSLLCQRKALELKKRKRAESREGKAGVGWCHNKRLSLDSTQSSVWLILIMSKICWSLQEVRCPEDNVDEGAKVEGNALRPRPVWDSRGSQKLDLGHSCTHCHPKGYILPILMCSC